MSEVYEAVQIIIVTGKGGYVLGDISVKSAMMVLKVLNTVYLAKWNGKTSLNRFRHIKGDDFLFINVGSEAAKALQWIEKELQSHGILFARMPDLCGGDGRTQYVMAPSDMSKFKAFLLDHNDGRYKNITVGPISASDYANTGYDAKGKETPEFRSFAASAGMALEDKQKGVTKLLTDHTMKVFANGDKVLVKENEAGKLPELIPAIRQHDLEVDYKNKIVWMKQEPERSHKNWYMFSLDDEHTIMIPRVNVVDRIVNAEDREIQPTKAAILPHKSYIVVNRRTGKQITIDGKELQNKLSEQLNERKNLMADLAPAISNIMHGGKDKKGGR